MKKELTVIERATQALAPVATEAALRELAGKFTDVTEVKSSTDVRMVRPAIAELRTTRVAITKTGKTARDDANAFAKAVIGEERRLIGIIEPEETRLKALVDAYEAEQERIKKEARQKEQARVDGIRSRIAGWDIAACKLEGAASNRIVAFQAELAGIEIDDGFAEFRDDAAVALTQAKAKMNRLLAEAMEREEREAEAKRQAEAEAEARREETQRLAAERAAMEASRRELEAQQAEARRQQEEADRIQRQQAEKMAAERAAMAAERREIERQRKAALDAERDRLAAERAKVERQQAEAAERERQRLAEVERQQLAAEAESARVQALRESPLVEAICRAAAHHHGGDPDQWETLAPTVAEILGAHQ